ncbi:MAG: dihydropteroate synthase [Myxococcota bacterium]|nr:dihydropteroate synthase [Myxococcales bacterium]
MADRQLEPDAAVRTRAPAAAHPFREGTTTLMGVLNATPDSFSDGGRFVRGERVDLAGALAAAKELEEGGADVLDVGGESTRPGAEPVSLEVELARVRPVVEALAEATGLPISIDTRKARVAAEAIAAGARVVNDVSGLRTDPELADVAAEAGAWLVVGHMRGTPATMQRAPRFDDVRAEVARELAASIALARERGVPADRIVADPGIGFGKRLEDNLVLIARAGELRRELGVPVLLGPSRKSFLGALTGDPVERRDDATLAVCAVASFLGVDALRVHDAARVRRAVAVGRALAAARPEDAR